jgi:drug/metabolite transporter (DMT)-like permease
MGDHSLVLLLVLVAACLHASWNAFVKLSGDRLLTLAIMMAAGGALCLVGIPWVAPPTPAAWNCLGLSVLCHQGYCIFLLQAYRYGDLSQVYPIARGSGPLIVALLSAPVIGERLGAWEVGGVVTICLGVVSLTVAAPGQRPGRAVLFALGTGGFIAAYSIIDGLGVRSVDHPLSYILWMNFLEGLPLLAFVLVARRPQLVLFFRAHGGKTLAAGVLAATAYALVIWAYSLGAIAPIAALRETSVLLAAFIGTRLMREPFGSRRVFAAALVVGGILLLNVI